MKLFLTVIVFLLICLVPAIWAQDSICDGLQELKAEHGNDLVGYLSSAGQDCLDQTKTLAASVSTAAGEMIWSESRRGDAKISVSLELSQGTYSLELLDPSEEGSWGNAWLEDIISIPENCFPWFSRGLGARVSFSSHLPVHEDCRLYATLNVELPYGENTSWEVGISKHSDVLPSPSSARDWSARGRGTKFLPMDISFEPGIYRLGFNITPDGHDGILWVHDNLVIPSRCAPRFHDVPTQFRIENDCRVMATLTALLSGDNADSTWEVFISKLDQKKEER